MKINFIIDTENASIDILYRGYNIIATTIYNEELTKNIYNMLNNETIENDFETLEELTTLK